MFVRVRLNRSFFNFIPALLSLVLVSCGGTVDSPKQELETTTAEVNDTIVALSDDDEFIATIRDAGIKPDTNAILDAFQHSWTNGGYWISPEIINDPEFENSNIQVVEFMGGDRHEGGYNFFGALLNDSSIVILTSTVQECVEGDLLKLKKEDDIDYLSIQDSAGKIKGIFVRSDLTLGNDIDIKVQENLAGTFFENETGDTIQFIDSIKTVIWNSEEFKFNFEADEYEALVDVISFMGQSFFFERDGDQLKLTKAQLNEEESFIEWMPIGDPRYFQLISKSDERTFKEFMSKVK